MCRHSRGALEAPYVKPPPCEMVRAPPIAVKGLPLGGSLRSALSGHP